MAGHGIARVTIRRQRGKLTVQSIGQSMRGQKYIKQEVILSELTTAGPEFKSQLAAAVTELFTESGLPGS